MATPIRTATPGTRTGTCISAAAATTRAGDHSHVPGILGAVFAVSGLRALTMMAPFGDAGPGGFAASMLTLLYLIAVFAVGIVISMSLFGVVLSRVLGSVWLATHVGRGAAVITALASIALGVYWIVVRG